MPKVDGREYRSISITDFTTTDDDCIVEGYATTWNDPYEFGMGFEQIDRNALDGADMSDVIFQYDHQGMVLARQKNGTLGLTIDDHGLHVRANLGTTEAGRQTYEAIKSGLVDSMSWGFMVADGGFDYDPQTRTSTITKVSKVYDVSAVSIPANPGTEIKARSYLDGVIEAEEQELLRRQQERKRIAIRMSLC